LLGADQEFLGIKLQGKGKDVCLFS